MPSSHEPIKQRTLQDVVDELQLYPIEAFDFVQRGLNHTVTKVHGAQAASRQQPQQHHHVTGQQLCQGLREYALLQWGFLAGAVLGRWNIHGTLDVGRIVFALVESGLMQATDDDSIDDFKNVFDFKAAFETDYRMQCKQL